MDDWQSVNFSGGILVFKLHKLPAFTAAQNYLHVARTERSG